MRAFDYARPETIEQALALLDGAERTDGLRRPLAGGTDLLTLMKADIVSPHVLIDIKRLPELDDRILDTGDGLEIGALATLTQLEADPLIRARYPALAEAAAAAASPQLRNMATIGGNLLQRPRCWYFRSPHVTCWLKGGDACPARNGENQLHALFGADPCVAVHPSDPATALVALGAEVRLRSAERERTIPIEEFFALPTDERRTETTIGSDELIVAIRLPGIGPMEQPAGGTVSTYLKAMDRKVWAFAVVGVAAALRFDGRLVSAARIVLGGVSPIPHRAVEAEQILTGAELSEAIITQAATAALADATPLRLNGYKIPLAEALTRRALHSLAGGARAVA
jgi:xanthine dehydrogenase YagS FAD-binding subunit